MKRICNDKGCNFQWWLDLKNVCLCNDVIKITKAKSVRNTRIDITSTQNIGKDVKNLY